MRTCQQFWFPRRDGCFRSTLSFKSQARDSGADWRVKKTPRWIKRAAGEVIEKGTDLSVPLTMGNNVTPILEQSKGELGLVIKDPKSISRPHTLSQGNYTKIPNLQSVSKPVLPWHWQTREL